MHSKPACSRSLCISLNASFPILSMIRSISSVPLLLPMCDRNKTWNNNVFCVFLDNINKVFCKFIKNRSFFYFSFHSKRFIIFAGYYVFPTIHDHNSQRYMNSFCAIESSFLPGRFLSLKFSHTRAPSWGLFSVSRCRRQFRLLEFLSMGRTAAMIVKCLKTKFQSLKCVIQQQPPHLL